MVFAYNDELVRDEGGDLISNLKLQKLLYYAQGCSLAINDQALFQESIVAWRHGPVVESIYHTFKRYGDGGIVYDDGIVTYNSRDIDSNTVNLLEQVYEVFGKYSAWQLRNLTHQEDPWKNTEQSDRIDLESIQQYFKDHYVTEDDEKN